MATTALGNQLTRRHRRQQLALRALVLRQVVAAWSLFDIEDIDESWARIEPALIEMVRNGRSVSSGLASGYYREFRAAEGISGSAPLVTPSNAWETPARISLRVTGPVAAKTALKLHRPDASAVALVRLSGAVSRHVLDAGRETILESVGRDPVAKGWMRVTDGNPCAFCALLASRGASYKSEETASFAAHDHCGCEAEPTFVTNAPLSAEARRFRDIYDRAAQGLSGREARRAFREALAAG